jgi:regulator of sigma E protease
MILHSFLLISDGWSQALQLLAAISILVSLHEFGHFYFARLFKTRVEKFYLFFDFFFPFANLLNFSLFKKKIGDTEYGIGWFPLGGYVKIAGMMDESMDKDAMKLPPQPWEYRSKKAWQRLFIMLGGIIMNVLVAIFIYILTFGLWGEKYLPVESAKFGIMVDSVGESIGFKNGDRVLKVDDKPVKNFKDIYLNLLLHKDNGTILLNRNGKDTVITIPELTVSKILASAKKSSKKGTFVGPRFPTVIDSVGPFTQAKKLHLQKGDSILTINGAPAGYYDQFVKLKSDNINKPMNIVFMRNGQADSVTITVQADSAIGFFPFGATNPERYFTPAVIKYNPLEATAKGFTYTWDNLVLYVAQFKLMTSKGVKIHENLGGFGTMASMYAPQFDLQSFLSFTAFISIALAFMNLLPIPGLDGGYVLFLLWEMITGRQVNEKVMEWTTTIGLILLMGLMLLANGMDVVRHFFNK